MADADKFAVLDESGQPTGKFVTSPPERGILISRKGVSDPTADDHEKAVKDAASPEPAEKPAPIKS